MTPMSDAPPPARQLIPAATAVIFRRAPAGPPELLMVQRSKALRFAGGAAVFPGGKVDPADQRLAARLMPDDDPMIAAGRIAAIRETLEETGLVIGTHERASATQAIEARRLLLSDGELEPVLQHFGWTIDTGRLTLYAHWRAPLTRAFDTLFFVTDLGTGNVDLIVDQTENSALFWVSARRALEMADDGEISVVFPTRRNLERLALFGSYEEALAQIARYPVRRITPSRGERNGELWLEIPDGLGYPVLGEPYATAKRT